MKTRRPLRRYWTGRLVGSAVLLLLAATTTAGCGTGVDASDPALPAPFERPLAATQGRGPSETTISFRMSAAHVYVVLDCLGDQGVPLRASRPGGISWQPAVVADGQNHVDVGCSPDGARKAYGFDAEAGSAQRVLLHAPQGVVTFRVSVLDLPPTHGLSVG